jgi:alkaline phosphatase D
MNKLLIISFLWLATTVFANETKKVGNSDIAQDIQFKLPAEINPDNVTNRNPEMQALLEPKLRPFYHGVASGDPLQDKVIIWTRITKDDDADIEVQWRISKSPNMANPIKSGNFTTNKDLDFTVKVDVTGLEPGTTYYYDFRALGRYSLIGRTRTLTNDNQRLRFAVVSCANLEWGYFNAFGRIAERADLDAVIHLGDYFYEYASGNYADTTLNRKHQPAYEIVSYIDYSTRIAEYRLDPDLRKAHQQHPFIMIWDDHETANDSYPNGAENHDNATEGDWNTRKLNALKAYYNWMPVRIIDNKNANYYRNVKFGNLLDLMMLELRLTGRDQQIAPKGATDASVDTALWFNPNRTLLGKTQFDWLANNLKSSSAKWKLLGSSVMMMPWLGFTNYDSWEGYPAEREAIYKIIKDNNIQNVGVLSGDIHTSFCANLVSFPSPGNYEPNTGVGAYGFEFTTPSVTSANLNELLRQEPNSPLIQAFEANFKTANKHFKYLELSSHGYLTLSIDENKIQSDWFYTEINKPDMPEKFATSYYLNINSNKIENSTTPAAAKSNPPQLAPNEPVLSIEDHEEIIKNRGLYVLGIYPNPANDFAVLNYVLTKPMGINISIFNSNGKFIKEVLSDNQISQNHRVNINLGELSIGTYIVRISSGEGSIDRTISVVR